MGDASRPAGSALGSSWIQINLPGAGLEFIMEAGWEAGRDGGIFPGIRGLKSAGKPPIFPPGFFLFFGFCFGGGGWLFFSGFGFYFFLIFPSPALQGFSKRNFLIPPEVATRLLASMATPKHPCK